jgi:phage terminase large subunit-like protein
MPWQWRDIIGPLYGWKRPDGTRRFRRGSTWVPKKAGKTELSAALALYHLVGDGESNPHVALAAVDRYQSSICFDAAARMVRRSPALARKLEILDSRKRIVAADIDGRMEALSADAASKEGLHLSFAVFDEKHAWKDRDFHNSLLYAGAARKQPLFVTISTAGVRSDGNIGWEEYEYAAGVLDGTIDDNTWHPVIYGAPPEADWTQPETWRLANPSLGRTVFEEELAEQCRMAQQSPPQESAFKRYRLNIWVTHSEQAVDPRKWDENDQHAVTERDFEGARAFGGLDLAATSDLNAWVQIKTCDHDPDAIDVLVRCWLPQGALERSRNATLYRQWADEGVLALMPGPVAQYDFVTSQIINDAERWQLDSVGVDRLFSGLAVANALTDAGLRVFPVGQGFTSMGPLWREFERLLIAGKVHHGGHPILRWSIHQLELLTDAAGNRKPSRQNYDAKIDPVVALLMAIDRYARKTAEPQAFRSVYEESEGGIFTV